MTNAIHLTRENFEETIKNNEVVVIDFWASWCGPCQMMGPVFEELATEYHKAKTAILGKLSTEEEPEIATRQGVRGIPTLQIFKNGKKVDEIVGFGPKEAIKAKIDAAINE